MARATATIRQLKNKDTGIDLAVTSLKETKGLIGSAFEYEITVVTSLACFKNAKHKESDNVQFTVQKKFSDFEELHTKLNTKYTGTVFPDLPKKVIKVSAQVAKDRRPELDKFLKFLAMTDKLSSCAIILEFLGISSVKASNFRKAELTETSVKDKESESGEIPETTETETSKLDEDLFDDGAIGQDDADDDDDLFSDGNVNTDTTDDMNIFGDQDLGGALDDEEDSDLFVPDARSEVKRQVLAGDDEDNTDLLNIEDNFEDLVKLGTKPKAKQAQENNKQEDTKNIITKPAFTKKPSVPTKKPVLFTEGAETDNTASKVRTEPTKLPNPKPSLPEKPKPALRNKPAVGKKPTLAVKPELKPKPKGDNSENVATKTDVKEESNEADMNEDDILKYIQDNNANNDDDLDLFS